MTFFRIFSVLSLIILLGLSACSKPEDKKEDHYLKAMEYLSEKKQDSAIIELRNAIQIDPKYAEARYQLGLLYLEKGDARAAFGEIQRAASLDPKNLDAGTKVAEFYILGQNTKESRAQVEKVLAIDPNYIDALALLANIELTEEHFDKAQETLNKALALQADSTKLLNIQGRIYASQKNWIESEKIFTKIIETDPQILAPYKALTLVYLQQQQVEKAVDVLRKVQVVLAKDVLAQLFVASTFDKLQKPDLAEAAFATAIVLQPDNENIYLSAAEFYKKQQNPQQTETFLRTSIAKVEKNAQLQAMLAEVLFDTRKWDESKKIMDEVLITDSTNNSALLLKARFAIKENQFQEAATQLDALTTNAPKWAEPYYYLALVRLHLGDMEIAQKNISTALQKDPQNSIFHTLASQMSLMKGDSDIAEKEAAIALQINPRNFAAVKLLTRSLLQKKDFEKVIAIIDSIEKKIPLDTDLIGTQALAYLGTGQQEKASVALQKVLEAAPNNTKALTLLVSIDAKDDKNEAIATVEKYIAKAPKSTGHLLLLAQLYASTGESEKALELAQKAQTLDAKDPQSYILSARLMASSGKTDEAIKEFETLLAKDPNSIPALMGIATLYEYKGETTKAQENYRRVLQINPNIPVALNNLAWLIAEEENSDLGEALRLAMQAKQAIPDDANITDTLGWVHIKRKSYGLATSQFLQALETRENDPVILYHLAIAYQGDGKNNLAIESIKKALDNKKNFADRPKAELLFKNLTTATK